MITINNLRYYANGVETLICYQKHFEGILACEPNLAWFLVENACPPLPSGAVAKKPLAEYADASRLLGQLYAYVYTAFSGNAKKDQFVLLKICQDITEYVTLDLGPSYQVGADGIVYDCSSCAPAPKQAPISAHDLIADLLTATPNAKSRMGGVVGVQGKADA